MFIAKKINLHLLCDSSISKSVSDQKLLGNYLIYSDVLLPESKFQSVSNVEKFEIWSLKDFWMVQWVLAFYNYNEGEFSNISPNWI